MGVGTVGAVRVCQLIQEWQGSCSRKKGGQRRYKKIPWLTKVIWRSLEGGGKWEFHVTRWKKSVHCGVDDPVLYVGSMMKSRLTSEPSIT